MAHVTNIFANEVSWVFGLLVISWRCNYCDYDDDHHRLCVIELQGSILQVTKHLRSHPPRGTHARTCAIIINVLRYYYHHRKFYLSIYLWDIASWTFCLILVKSRFLAPQWNDGEICKKPVIKQFQLQRLLLDSRLETGNECQECAKGDVLL